jgi:dimethylaniline monooxygenase (N-oxide forming)
MQDIAHYIGHGWISIKPTIATLDGTSIEFVDGTHAIFDAIIYATGYKRLFRFSNQPCSRSWKAGRSIFIGA